MMKIKCLVMGHQWENDIGWRDLAPILDEVGDHLSVTICTRCRKIVSTHFIIYNDYTYVPVTRTEPMSLDRLREIKAKIDSTKE